MVPTMITDSWSETVIETAEAMKALVSKFNPAAAGGLDIVFGFNVTDEAKRYALLVENGTCTLQEGENSGANCTLVMDSDTLGRIVAEVTDFQQAYMGGTMSVEGDPMLSMKLSELFPS
jgi:putative sterol carrier protein